MRFYLKERAMKKNKHQGEGLIPAISRRQFIQPSGRRSPPCRLSSKPAKYRHRARRFQTLRLKKKWCKPVVRLTAAANVIFVLTSVMAL